MAEGQEKDMPKEVAMDSHSENLPPMLVLDDNEDDPVIAVGNGGEAEVLEKFEPFSEHEGGVDDIIKKAAEMAETENSTLLAEVKPGPKLPAESKLELELKSRSGSESEPLVSGENMPAKSLTAVSLSEADLPRLDQAPTIVKEPEEIEKKVSLEQQEIKQKRENFLEPPITNWKELYEAIDEAKEVQGSKQKFSALELKNIINLVRRGRLGYAYVTRGMGLRRAFLNLWLKEVGPVGQNDPFKNLVTGVKKETPVMASSASERSEVNNFPVVNKQEQKVSVGELTAQVTQEAFSETGPGELEKNKKEKGPRWWNLVRQKLNRWSIFGKKSAQGEPDWDKIGSSTEREINKLSGFLKVEDVDLIGDMELVKQRLRESGNDVGNMSLEELEKTYRWLATTIAEQKVKENIHYVDLIVDRSFQEIERRLREYKQGEYHLSSDKRQEIEQKIRRGLAAIRSGQVEKDMIRFGEMVGKSLSPDWYKDYVSKGMEEVMAFAK